VLGQSVGDPASRKEPALARHARRRVGLGDDERGLLDDEAALEVEDGGLLARLHLEAPEGHRALRRGDVVGGPRRASVRRVDTPPRQPLLRGAPGRRTAPARARGAPSTYRGKMQKS